MYEKKIRLASRDFFRQWRQRQNFVRQESWNILTLGEQNFAPDGVKMMSLAKKLLLTASEKLSRNPPEPCVLFS